MDIEAAAYAAFCGVYFSFTLLFSFFSLFLYIIRLKQWCDCEICCAYLSSSWTKRFTNLSDWYTHLLQNSPTSTIHVHVLNNIITSNPRNVEHVLKTSFHNYPKGKQFSSILGDLLGRGIFNSDGESWRFQRKIGNLELGSVSTRVFALKVINEEIETRLLPLLHSFAEEERVFDLQDVLRRFSFDVICKFSFGWNPRCLHDTLPESELSSAFDRAARLSAERALATTQLFWKIKRFLAVGSEKELKESIRTVHKLAEGLIAERRAMGNLSERTDLLSRFMSAIDDDVYLRDITVSFLLAGRDTVASALTCFFWLLSRDSATESSIRRESDQVMGPDGDRVNVTFDEMRDLHYLHAALYESMRLYPPVQFDSKFSLNDDVLADGTFVKRGTRVTYHPYAMGRMNRLWGNDSAEFKPERWLCEGQFRPESLYKYPVFQAGPRICLGKEMAVMEMKSVILAMVRRFVVNVVGPVPSLRFGSGLTATVAGGLPVLVRKRDP